MRDGLSFSIFDAVEVTIPIIFTTAYDQYAIKAFKVNSIDYLLKPIRIDDLRASLRKYRNLNSASRPDIEELLRNFRGKDAGYKKRFLVQFGDKIRKVQSEEIAFFYAMENSVFLTTVENQTYPVDFTLDKLVPIMNPEQFFRINRKMIVNFGAIRNMIPYSRSRIKIVLHPSEPNDVEALVSVERTSAFKEWMNK